MGFVDTIAAKRDGRSNSKEQLIELAQGAASGTIPDYQLSAWLMAAYLKGLTPQETADLTMAMAESGERLDLTGLPKPWLDKHSTGGVGDKTTLVVLPILAACGVTMVKMSGRGLGITGGTIDKLESIPGFRTDLSPEEMVDQAKRIGIALSGQTPRLAPADRALYALRDVTGTVASIPLITASILSKKIAGGADTVVLDVKCGSGAFMKTLPEAQTLARSLVDTGKLCGLKVSAVITDMDQPLGMAVGNLIEVQEALDALSKPQYELTSGTQRFLDLSLSLAGHALEVVGSGDRRSAEKAMESGRAFEKATQWIEAQGGKVEAVRALPQPKSISVLVHKSGARYVSRVDAQTVGECLLMLGGGRQQKTDEIDHVAGIQTKVEVGDLVQKGHVLFSVISSKPVTTEILHRLQAAVEFQDNPVEPVKTLLEVVN